MELKTTEDVSYNVFLHYFKSSSNFSIYNELKMASSFQTYFQIYFSCVGSLDTAFTPSTSFLPKTKCSLPRMNVTEFFRDLWSFVTGIREDVRVKAEEDLD